MAWLYISIYCSYGHVYDGCSIIQLPVYLYLDILDHCLKAAFKMSVFFKNRLDLNKQRLGILHSMIWPTLIMYCKMGKYFLVFPSN